MHEEHVISVCVCVCVCVCVPLRLCVFTIAFVCLTPMHEEHIICVAFRGAGIAPAYLLLLVVVIAPAYLLLLVAVI